ncbi:hypothetical protein [Microbacterium aurum]
MVKAAAVVGFNPENIISDALFYDGNAMTSAEIQTFLDAKIGACRNGKCLNVLTTGISSRDAVYSQSTGNLICSAIQGGSMKVSELIYRVQVACGISAKVILVTLQKEQGLTTSREPSDWNLKAAMGASCPDTAPCDPAFAGVGPQILKGTQQLKTYKAAKFAKQPGRNYVGYSPTESCGGTYLNIQNYATAALYSYTPYQPNAAALAAGYGLGDGCSSYGNRNFYNYYTDWFGSTQRDPAAEIQTEYVAQGGAATLGAPTSGLLTLELNGGGYARAYANGSIYWTVGNGAVTVKAGVMRDYYWARGGADGDLGWPIANQSAVSGTLTSGTAQAFTGGAVYASAAGTFAVRGDLRAAYFSTGGATGAYGWPTSDQTCFVTTCQQNFEGGLIVAGPGGSAAVTEPVRTAYLAAGGIAGSWGVPVTNTAAIPANGGGYGQAFAGGSVYYRANDRAWFVTGAIRDKYWSLSGAAGPLGFPLAEQEVLSSSTCRQRFDGGWVLWTASDGARIGDPAVDDAYAVAGGAKGVLGARTATFVAYSYNGGGFAEVFVGGAIFYKPSVGAHAVTGAVRAAYFATGGAAGALGWPTSDQTCSGSTCQQAFEGGVIVAGPAGSSTVTDPVRAGFLAAGGFTGSWGMPLLSVGAIAANGGGFGQAFAGGSAYYRAGGAAWYVPAGPIRDKYWGLDGAAGSLGFPLGAQDCTNTSSCRQRFDHGWILWTASGGARVGDPAVDAAYAAAGGAAGVLGARTGTFVWYPYNGSGVAEVFAGGAVFSKEGAGAHAVTGAVRVSYFATGGAAGAYGWPTSDQVCTATSCQQSFEGGTITVAR